MSVLSHQAAVQKAQRNHSGPECDHSFGEPNLYVLFTGQAIIIIIININNKKCGNDLYYGPCNKYQ